MTVRTLIAPAAAALLLLTACSGDGAGSFGTTASTAAATTSPQPDAAGDAVTLRGEFAPVPGAPPEAADIRGIAEQRRMSNGATVSVELSGLIPDADYIAHVHAGACNLPDPGGPHFKFDPSGSDIPPNEVHLQFTSDARGDGIAFTEVDRPLPDGQAESVVVHAAGGAHEHATPKLACAQLG